MCAKLCLRFLPQIDDLKSAVTCSEALLHVKQEPKDLGPFSVSHWQNIESKKSWGSSRHKKMEGGHWHFHRSFNAVSWRLFVSKCRWGFVRETSQKPSKANDRSMFQPVSLAFLAGDVLASLRSKLVTSTPGSRGVKLARNSRKATSNVRRKPSFHGAIRWVLRSSH